MATPTTLQRPQPLKLETTTTHRTMASTTISSPILHSLPHHRVRNAPRASVQVRHATKPAAAALPGRRQLALLLTATTTALTAGVLPSSAEEIGLFGLRKKLKSAEKEAEEIVKEGFEAAEKGIETAEKEIETAVSFGGLAQAGAVVGAEVVGVLVAAAAVNGILGPEGQRL